MTPTFVGWGSLESPAEASSNLGGWINHVKVQQNSSSRSYVAFSQGGQGISIFGSSEFMFKVNQTGAESGSGTTEASFTINTHWNLPIALGVVNDGLQIAQPPNTEATCSSEGTSNTTGIDWDVDSRLEHKHQSHQGYN
ncbi:hypothetical protein GGR58DRAFT_525344 [Xylaria digitata]|nr:hypothetical protein GGR58DRAFT_525344 [Xylaria digitata]